MTRRILAALLGFTAVVVIGVVLPLGLITARHQHRVFHDRTLAAAGAVAAYAEETLADGRASGRTSLASLDRYAVYDLRLRLVEGQPQLATDRALRRALKGDSSVNVGSRYAIATVPVREGDQIVGAIAFRRSTSSLHSELVELWMGLAVAAAIAALLAAALGVALAKWVSRPLRRLEVAALRVGEGELSERVALDGPPEVRQLEQTFNEMAGRLETLLYAHRSLVADVSHQLRTPLAAMRLRLELLQQDVEPVSAQELAAVLAEVARLSRLVDGLLMVARAEHATSTPQPLDAVEVLRQRAEAWRPLADERRVELGVDVRGRPVVSATPGHLEQVLDNLIANALEATPAAGRVSVHAYAAGERIQITVSDTGAGMSVEQQRAAVRRFWRDSPRDTDGGSGLGLAIVERLVTVDGGSVELSSVPGAGLQVRLDLPAARTTAPLPVPRSISAPTP